MATGMHSTVAKPTDEKPVEATEVKELWGQKADADLADKQKMLQTISFKLGDFDDEARTFKAIGSTPMVDRQGDSIEQSGWVLDNFIKNPVVPWAHIYYELPVARAIEVGVQDGNLVFTYQAPPEGLYPFADTVYEMYRHQFMFAFSVGFIPLEYEGNWEDGYNFTKCELLEISAVPVPANAGALVLAQKMGVMDNKQAKSMISKVEDALKQLKKANAELDAPKHQKDLDTQPVTAPEVPAVPVEPETPTEKDTEEKGATDTKVTIVDKKELKTMLTEILAEIKSTEDASAEAKSTDKTGENSEATKDLTNNDNMRLNDTMSETKSGAKLSAASKAKLQTVIDGLESMKVMADDHIKALSALHGSIQNDDAESDTDGEKTVTDATVKSVDDETTKVDETKEVDGEAKATDETSEESADQESEEDNKDDKSEASDKETTEEVEAVVNNSTEEEVVENTTESEATVNEDDKTAEDETKSVNADEEDLIDPDNLSDEDVVRLTAAVQAELDKDKEQE